MSLDHEFVHEYMHSHKRLAGTLNQSLNGIAKTDPDPSIQASIKGTVEMMRKPLQVQIKQTTSDRSSRRISEDQETSEASQP